MFNQSIFLIEDPAELFCVDNVSHGLMKGMGFVAAAVVVAVAVAVVVAQLQHENLFHPMLEAMATNTS